MPGFIEKLRSLLPVPSEPFPDVVAVREEITRLRVEALRSRQVAEQVLAKAAAIRAASADLRPTLADRGSP